MFSPRHSAEDKKKLLSEKFHINVTEEIGQEVSKMCNLSTGIFESGMEKGIEKGIEKGREKGIEKGRQEGMQEGIKQGNIQNARGMKAEGIPTETIAKITGLTPDEIAKL